MDNDQNDYMKELAIDLHRLEEEWAMQPQLYMKYSELAAQAQLDRDKAKERLDVVRAEIDDKIRTEPLIYGAPVDKSGNLKLTEAWISGTIILQPEYKTASDAISQENYKMNIFKAAVSAFDHRKKALENEVNLWSGGYWSAPNLPRDINGGKRFLNVAAIARDEKQGEQRKEINRRRRNKE